MREAIVGVIKKVMAYIEYALDGFGYKLAKITKVKSGIVNPPSIQYFCRKTDEIDRIINDGVSIIWFGIDKDLNCYGENKEPLGTYFSVVKKVGGRAICGYLVDGEISAVQIAAQLARDKTVDAFIASEDDAALESAYFENSSVGRVLILNGNLSGADVIVKLNRAHSRLLTVKGEMYTRDLVSYYAKRMIGVFVNAEGELSKAYATDMVFRGANGICTRSPGLLKEIISSYNEKVLVRNPVIIGHRGISSNLKYAENTLTTAAFAKQCGATVIDADTRLTKDNKLIVFHGKIIDRMLSGKGATDSFTYDELRNMKFNYGLNPEEKVPLLEDFMLYLAEKNPDIMFTTEIGGVICDSVEILRDILERNPVLRDKLIVKCKDGWYGHRIVEERIPWAIPRVYTQQHTSAYLGGEKATVHALKFLRTRNVPLSDSVKGYSKKLFRNLQARGIQFIIILPKSTERMTDEILNGMGLLVGNVELLRNMACSVNVEPIRKLKVNQPYIPQINVISLDGTSVKKKPTVIKVIEGQEFITVSGTEISPRSSGVAFVQYGFNTAFANNGYVLYTEVQKLEVE